MLEQQHDDIDIFGWLVEYHNSLTGYFY